MRLEKFRKAKAREIESLRRALDSGRLAPAWTGERPDFREAISRPAYPAPLAIVAEYKRASPSRGAICSSLAVEDAAAQYCAAGASAISILTEADFFDGNIDFLRRAAREDICGCRRLPLLRKDFVFDHLQVLQTAATPASAMLLIVRLTPDRRALRELREETEKFGMRAVVEVFDESDLSVARDSGAEIIQVNARDLDSLKVDREAAIRLARRNPPQGAEIWIAASGISLPEHLQEAADAGYRAVLVGSSLMEGGKPGQALGRLRAGCHAGEASTHAG